MLEEVDLTHSQYVTYINFAQIYALLCHWKNWELF